MSDSGVFAHAYVITLLLERPVELDAGALLAALRRSCGAVEPGEADAMFVFPERTANLADAPGMPVMCAVTESTEAFDRDRFVDALQQTWDWDEAAGCCC